jgi:predicted TIM-barrel fold metal-dependent hydrolase
MTITELAGIKVIDVDTHVIEPYDLWTSRVSTARWGDVVPHVERNADGVDMWFSGSNSLGLAAGPAQVGWPEHPPLKPPTMDDAQPYTWRALDRLKIMDEYGIYAQILYPNVSGFGAGRFSGLGEPELRYELLRAYNDFLTDWSSADPDRLIPVMATPFWDIDLSIKEMTRCREMGHRGLIFSQAPEDFGSPTLADPHWDRLWAAAQEMEMSVNFHIGSGDSSTTLQMLPASVGIHSNFASFPVTFFVSNCRTIATLIGGGVCHRFPELNFVSVESGIGWIPFTLQALDWMWTECGVYKEHPEYDLTPSEYFRRQIFGCFWFEKGPTLDAAIDYLGADSVLYETDFPHPTSMAPGPNRSAVLPSEFISDHLAHYPSEVRAKILHDNAARVYHLA